MGDQTVSLALATLQIEETLPFIVGSFSCTLPALGLNNMHTEKKAMTALIWKREAALPQRAAMTNEFCKQGGDELQQSSFSSCFTRPRALQN